MPPRSARLELAAEPAASREARQATRSVLQGWQVPAQVVDDALLVVSELVTNAVRHAGESSTLELELDQDGSSLRVALADGSTESPSPRPAPHAAEGGRGMTIMAALSDRWGIAPHNGGKQVWWEVDLGSRYGEPDAASETARRANVTASA
ncbi:MAG TPA: ATP-binding protein [Mycobacteriales bacterium]|nr:ATP-binding protein [Mycobacteriales bacterium]